MWAYSTIICNHFQKFQKFKNSSFFWWPKSMALKVPINNTLVRGPLGEGAKNSHNRLCKCKTPIYTINHVNFGSAPQGGHTKFGIACVFLLTQTVYDSFETTKWFLTISCSALHFYPPMPKKVKKILHINITCTLGIIVTTLSRRIIWLKIKFQLEHVEFAALDCQFNSKL